MVLYYRIGEPLRCWIDFRKFCRGQKIGKPPFQLGGFCNTSSGEDPIQQIVIQPKAVDGLTCFDAQKSGLAQSVGATRRRTISAATMSRLCKRSSAAFIVPSATSLVSSTMSTTA